MLSSDIQSFCFSDSILEFQCAPLSSKNKHKSVAEDLELILAHRHPQIKNTLNLFA